MNGGKIMLKKLFFVLTAFLAFNVTVFASSANIDLREYQQSPKILNVMAAPFENDNFHIATFNFDQQQTEDKLNFYQGICLIDKDNNKLNPLNVKKIITTGTQSSEIVLNKQKQPPYKQDYRQVQTTSSRPQNYLGGDSNNIVYLGKFKIITKAGTFDDCIGIKIYNDKTGEGMVQYLDKGYGVVYMEGIKADGTAEEIAHLEEIHPLEDEDISSFKTKYFI